MATDAQSLFTAANCYFCQGVSIAQAMKLALLAQISVAHNASNKTDPATLIALGSCYACYGELLSMGDLMELALLKQIAT